MSFTEILKKDSRNCLPLEEYCKAAYSCLLIREHHDSVLFYIQYKSWESNFTSIPFAVDCNPDKNNNNGIFSETNNPEDVYKESRRIGTFSDKTAKNN